ncbi:MAG TPA: CHAT domain-containing protein [Pyrinomonadaceae bacterium]|nr:CHAT domain-containing protein [Pyrinomonadaceae bacterium]
MKQPENQKHIKHYLLGELSQEDQQRQFEEKLLTDDLLFEELLIAEDDLIDNYLSRRLTEKEKENFENYFLSTDERQRKLRFARALKKYVSIETTKATVKGSVSPPQRLSSIKSFFTSPVWVAVSVLIVLALGLGVWRAFIYQSDVSKGMLALKTAYREQRPTEARLTVLDYAPLPQTRGAEQGKVDNQSRERAQRFLLDAVKDNPGANTYHALGLFYLTELKFDQAIEQFKKAIAINGNDAQLQSDLGAALLEKGKLDRLNREEGKSLEEFAESLEHLNRALALNDSLLEALFNRALCRQYMLLPQQAADDWRKYLEKDSQSPWADEARQNLKLIESQKNRISQNKEEILQNFLNAYRVGDEETAWRLISSNRDVTGSFVENTLLDRYLGAAAEDRAEDARDNLQALSYTGALELKRANDRFISDLLRFYQSATQPQRASLAEARSLMSQGHKNLQTFKPEEAVQYYSKAKLIFERMGDDGESAYISYPLGHAYLLMHRSELSLDTFQAVAHNSEVNQYRWLHAQALNGLGNVQTALNDYSTALDHTNRSWEISEQIGDVRGLMKTADQLSNIYTRLGNSHKAIEYQQRGLALIVKGYAEPLQVWRSHFLMATPLHLLGLNAAAADFQKEALRVAIEAGLPYYICRSYIGLGLIYGSQRNYEEATRNARLAFDLAKNISSDAIRADTLAYSSLQLGHLYRQAGDFDKAMASYDQVLKTYDGSDYQAFLYAAHKGKLLSCIAQGVCPSVEQEIEATLHLFENYRSKILEEENKFIFFDAEQSVYDVVIDYEHSVKHNFQTAFEFSERSRARSLLDLTNTETLSLKIQHHQDKGSALVSRPMEMWEIQQRMPEQAQILQYAVLQDKILIWLVSKSGVQSFEQMIDAKELREKVSNYLRLLSSPPVNNEEEVTRASAYFYDLLIKPVESMLDRNKQLCIVPDKLLNYLPYGAFVSGSSGKYLTNEYILTRAPSSTIFIISSENARSKDSTTPEKLLSVGNPRFDHREFPTLDDLSAAEREAEEIAAYYNSAPAITGEKALKRRVVSEMESADVIHLALHALVNEQSPLHSKLLFARETSSESSLSEDNILHAHEIYKLRLPQTQLVVLSACQTGAGRYYGGEGMISISRPFIAKGVPLVVASLWPVDSNATAELMISFHKNRKSGGLSTAEALSLAQREMLGNPHNRYRQPYYWASFVTIGGYARF